MKLTVLLLSGLFPAAGSVAQATQIEGKPLAELLARSDHVLIGKIVKGPGGRAYSLHL